MVWDVPDTDTVMVAERVVVDVFASAVIVRGPLPELLFGETFSQVWFDDADQFVFDDTVVVSDAAEAVAIGQAGMPTLTVGLAPGWVTVRVW